MNFNGRGTVLGAAALLCAASLSGCPPTEATCGAGLVLSTDGRCVALDAGSQADAGDAGPAVDANRPDANLPDTGVPHDAFMSTNDAFMPGVDACTLATYYADTDHDGHGNPAATMSACSAPTGYVAVGDDCDDASATRFPTNPEICDGLDNDCNTTVDNGFACVLGTSASCTTSCGSTGTGPCSATCTAATGAACAAPVETCDNLDQDCDGLIDETVRAFGPRRDVGAGITGIEALATPSGYVTIYSAAAIGVRAQRLDPAGALSGAPVTLGSGVVFGAAVTGTNLIVASTSGNNIVAAVFSTVDLSVVTPSTTITALIGASELRVVTNGASVAFVATDSVTLGFTSRGLPGLTGSGGLTTIDGNVRGDFDAASFGAHAFVTYVDTTYNVETRGFTIGGAIDGAITATLASGGAPMRRPTITVGTIAGVSQLGIAWEHNGGTAGTQHFYLASFDIAAAGTLTAHLSTTAFYSGINALAPPGSQSRTLDVIYANGVWVVSIFSGASTSYWSVIEVQPTDGSAGAPIPIEASPFSNLGAAIASGGGARILVSATRSDSTNARAYLWACGT